MFGLTSAGLITAFLAVYAISYFKTASEINDKLNFHEELEVMAAGSVALGSEKTDAVIIKFKFKNLNLLLLRAIFSVEIGNKPINNKTVYCE